MSPVQVSPGILPPIKDGSWTTAVSAAVRSQLPVSLRSKLSAQKKVDSEDDNKTKKEIRNDVKDLVQISYPHENTNRWFKRGFQPYVLGINRKETKQVRCNPTFHLHRSGKLK